MKSKIILKKLEKYEARGMHRQLPVVWKSAHGSQVLDVDNKMYIDFTSGIFVTNVGHGLTREAVKDQADQLMYTYTFPTLIRALLVETLVQMTPPFCEKVFLLSSGSEAVECAGKLMRMNARNRYRDVIVSIKGAMHGKTMFAEKLAGDKGDNSWAGTGDPSIYHLPFPDGSSTFEEDMALILQKRGAQDIAGFLLESYQGWSGRFMNKKYIQRLAKFAHKHAIPLCFDEVQGGFGRTGYLFAYERYEVEPDLIVVGKGLGNGMPISAVLGRKSLLDIPYDLSSTYSGNPMSCMAALETLTILEQDSLVKNAYKLHKVMQKRVKQIADKSKHITEINIAGLLAGILFTDRKKATKVCDLARRMGLLLVFTDRESVKLGPPLCITKQELLQGLDILERAVRKI